MKALITLLCITICGIANSQEKKLVWTHQTCEKGTEKAKTDFSNGNYNCYSYGLVIQSNPDFSAYYDNYLKTKYGINIENKGCVITDFSRCYSETMEKLVYEKFGSDIFEKSLKEAKKIYNKKK